MNKIIIFLLTITLSTNLLGNSLTILTYDSFVSEWGPGPLIEKKFEEKYQVDVNFISVDSAATLLTKVVLEGNSTKADIVLGLDMNLLSESNESNLFHNHNITNLEDKLDLPISWESKKFIPYNYGYFAFVYNNKKVTKIPLSMNELIDDSDLRIVIQDPRTSTPGLGLLTWIKYIYGNDSSAQWKKLNKKIVTVTKGWTDAYYNVFMAGEADLVLSYTTSPAAHIMFEDNYDISAINFEEGNYLSVEFAGILKTSKNKKLANTFMDFMLSDDFQSVIPSTNIMYPVNKNNKMPESFKNLEKPKALQIDPEQIRKNRNMWIEEWLNAS